MAILEGLPGVQVTVQSHEADLPEFEDDEGWTYRKFSHLPEGNRVSKYVECTTDAEFRIRLTLRYPFQMTSQNVTFKASVDGYGIAQASCNMEYFQRSYGFYMELITSRLERISPTELSSRALKFSSLKKVDDLDSTRVKNDAKLVAGIGEIVVSVFRTVQREVPLPLEQNYNSNHHEPLSEVAEKALKGKAISHGVAYGEQKIVTRTAKEYMDIDGTNNPIGVFVFKYRSRADLQSELIIPRPPSPVAANDPLNQRSRNIGNIPVSRAVRLANLKREIDDIKREGAEGSEGRKRGLDPELQSGGRAYKTSRTSEGKVCVDLTDD